ncbi:MAG: glycyl-radical enzyme activating protein [Dehalococcoidia bacterium]
MVFDIQKYSIHDGPGIRTLVFLKGCPQRCLWCSNPEGQSGAPELVFYAARCRRLNRCVQACPAHAISLEGESLFVNKDLCDLCGECVAACYAGAWKIFGKTVDVEYLVREIEKDALFYRNSGGGITFGGGEPLLWPDFLNEASQECRRRGIHVAVETAGHVPWRSYEKVIGVVDLIMYDIKHMDSEVHEQVCGVANELILANIESLSKQEVDIIIRVPIIPGITDSKDNIRETARFVASLNGSIIGVEILPYHEFGIGKYAILGRKYELEDLEVPGQGHMEEIKGEMEAYGLSVKIGG